jgi:mRNA interferase MazF
MIPKVGDVFMIDLGFKGKVRPAVVVSREDPDAPWALSVLVPLTKQNHGTRYEVLPRVPWLNLQSHANVLGLASVEYHELKDKRGRFEASVVAKIKDAIRWTCDL